MLFFLIFLSVSVPGKCSLRLSSPLRIAKLSLSLSVSLIVTIRETSLRFWMDNKDNKEEPGDVAIRKCYIM